MWFDLIFSRRYKSIDAGLNPRRKLCGIILIGNVKKINAWRLEESPEMNPSLYVGNGKKSLIRRFLFNRRLKRDTNRHYTVTLQHGANGRVLEYFKAEKPRRI